MIVSRDWPFLYEVLDQVKEEESTRGGKGRPRAEGWIGEEFTTTSRDDGRPVDVEVILNLNGCKTKNRTL